MGVARNLLLCVLRIFRIGIFLLNWIEALFVSKMEGAKPVIEQDLIAEFRKLPSPGVADALLSPLRRAGVCYISHYIDVPQGGVMAKTTRTTLANVFAPRLNHANSESVLGDVRIFTFLRVRCRVPAVPPVPVPPAVPKDRPAAD